MPVFSFLLRVLNILVVLCDSGRQVILVNHCDFRGELAWHQMVMDIHLLFDLVHYHFIDLLAGWFEGDHRHELDHLRDKAFRVGAVVVMVVEGQV